MFDIREFEKETIDELGTNEKHLMIYEYNKRIAKFRSAQSLFLTDQVVFR
jgi:hypothetical protein